MPLSLNPFATSAADVVATTLGLDAELFPVGNPPNPELGDFAVGCFPAAKLKGKAPAALAQEVVSAFKPNAYLAQARAAGPFVNFFAQREALFRHLFTGAKNQALVPKTVGSGKTICIDYSSPNISKHLAYHHIRSTVIGHALALLYGALGYRVVGINHLGDWGTTHGMLIAAYKKWGAPEPLTIDALNDLYVRFRAEMKENPALEEEGRAWFKKLEDGDTDARALWQRFRDVSLAEFQSAYDVLGITFDLIRGESEYESGVSAVLQTLSQKKLSSESEGALVVDLEADGMPPLLLRKQDGATLYGTRDLAAAIYRWDNYKFEENLYVVDRGQSLHFKQLFRVLEMAGYDWAKRCRHVPFGLVRIGGKKTGTRSGNVVLLKEVFAEAERLSKERIQTANPDMKPADVDKTARTIGIGAVVFANLVSQREKDVDFSWDEVLSWEGDSAPYIQYAHARCSSILERAGSAPDFSADVSPLAHDFEWQLAKKLCDLPDVVLRATKTDEPHHVCHYLLETCAAFSRWYTAGNQDQTLRVIGSDPKTSAARVALVAATRATLQQGLAVLGIDAPDAM
jgi:arginyl-tRNA synthetase